MRYTTDNEDKSLQLFADMLECAAKARLSETTTAHAQLRTDD